MTFNKIMQDLKSGKYKPVYLLMGDETYYIDKVVEYIANNALKEDEKDFNQTIMYGQDASAGIIDNASRRFPMMAERQVIIVKEAQTVIDIENLSYYTSKPSPTTVLVLAYKYKLLPKNRKLFKAISKTGVVLESKKMYENRIPEWVNNFVVENGYTIDPKAAVLITEFLGNNLSKIANEIEKIFISIEKKTMITAEIVEQNIGISKDYNNFELQNAIVKKNVLKANRIINYFAKNQKENPAILTIISLFFFFSKVLAYHFADKRGNIASLLKINPYFLKDYEMASKKYKIRKTIEIISLLREYDLKLKGVGNVSSTPGDLLKELIYKIVH